MNTLFAILQKNRFDILKKDRKGTFHWVESVEFVIFRESELRVIATYSDNAYRRL